VIPLDSIEGVTRADLAAGSDHLPVLVEITPAEPAGPQ
jgi:endonuclease/exonuclease/phosphatase family metal-dependent hydrolase